MNAAEPGVDHHLFAVMRPALDEGSGAENLFRFRGLGSVQMQELDVMSRIGFVDRDDVGAVGIERGQPLVLLLLGPVVLRRRDVVVGFRRPFLEGARRVHRSKTGRAPILRSFFHLRPDFRRNRDQFVIDDIFANRIQFLRDFGKQVLGGGMFALDLLEDFDRRFVRVDFLRGLGENLLFVF